MKWISNLSGRFGRNVHLIAVLVLCLVLIFGGHRVTSLVSGATINIFYYPFFKVKNTVTELSAVNAENSRLQLALVEASVRLSRLEEAERENARLRTVLGFDPPAGYSLLPARIISVAGGVVPTAAVINRGARDSICVDQPLINEQGLFGRVVSVSSDVSTVQLLTDPAHRVAVRVAGSREMGIVKYQHGRGMVLANFPVQGSIEVGDLIVSSGLGGIYPPGLAVGTVTSVVRPEEEPFCQVCLASAANFNSLEEVFILRADKR